ncbi:energy-coupling factor transport system substrate-specific component [Entomoplasma freundtii]|uniref:Uncharacterized protein n=1 Tax=Entomoplasma freundtii TaxID=74700 RepID=A0A2K8NUS0_9MOLU|nr:hypothetical protein [Entomoplasma freundtii]ATZ16511.1 hypothetical protein EFREU_v1c04860 [Entomoplasma freundtii]TDY56041.1 energy-coupling factor transport system substrate-specific component [Entomoplasma freundtii]
MRIHRQWISTLKLTFIATYVALVYGLQVALASIPNVETVTLLLFIAAIKFPVALTLLMNMSFVLLEAITYGFGDWVLFYIVVWNLLMIIGLLCRPLVNRYWGLAVFIGASFGFLFGTIDALIKGFLYGTSGMLAYWFSGLVFDLIHGISNFLIFLFCYLPMSKVVSLYINKYFFTYPSRPKEYFLTLKEPVRLWIKMRF